MKTDLIKRYVTSDYNRHQIITKFKVLKKTDKYVIVKLRIENHDFIDMEYQVQKLKLKLKIKNIQRFKKGKYIPCKDYKILKSTSVMKKSR